MDEIIGSLLSLSTLALSSSSLLKSYTSIRKNLLYHIGIRVGIIFFPKLIILQNSIIFS